MGCDVAGRQCALEPGSVSRASDHGGRAMKTAGSSTDPADGNRRAVLVGALAVPAAGAARCRVRRSSGRSRGTWSSHIASMNVAAPLAAVALVQPLIGEGICVGAARSLWIVTLAPACAALGVAQPVRASRRCSASPLALVALHAALFRRRAGVLAVVIGSSRRTAGRPCSPCWSAASSRACLERTSDFRATPAVRRRASARAPHAWRSHAAGRSASRRPSDDRRLPPQLRADGHRARGPDDQRPREHARPPSSQPHRRALDAMTTVRRGALENCWVGRSPLAGAAWRWPRFLSRGPASTMSPPAAAIGPIVDWFLAFGMRNSVELRAMAITPPPLDNPDLVRLGAGHFHGGCAFCHGAPGIPVSPIARHMLPSPPDLTTSMRPWTDEELFWIVQHGIKYTGMPGWVALEREDEIWAVVAFLKRMPSIDAEQLPRARARRRSHARPDRRGAGHRRIRTRRVPAPARAAMAPRAAGRRARWCRSCTASLPSS